MKKAKVIREHFSIGSYKLRNHSKDLWAGTEKYRLVKTSGRELKSTV